MSEIKALDVPVTTSGPATPAPFLQFTVDRQRLREMEDRGGIAFRHLQGDLAFADGLADVWVTTPISCVGNLAIGKGTTLHVAGTVAVGIAITGRGSLQVDRGRVDAHAVKLGGHLVVGLGINVAHTLHVKGSIICGDNVDAGAGIYVDSTITAQSGVCCDHGDIVVKGRVDAGIPLIGTTFA